MKSNPDNHYFKRMVEWVNSFEPRLWSDMARVPDLAPEVGLALLGGFLELACGCQNVGNIMAGRDGIQALPHAWVMERIEAAAEPLLQPGDDYEWWRVLDVYEGLDKGLMKRLALRALDHPNPEIKEAGEAFLEA